MKKRTFLSFLLGLITVVCYSQVKFNVQGGVGLSDITKNQNYNPRISYRFGIGVELPIGQTWAFQTGLQFLERKYSFDKSHIESDLPTTDGKKKKGFLHIDSKISAIYFQIPAKIATYLPLSTNSGLQLSTGPYFAFGVDGNSILNWTLITIPDITDADGHPIIGSGATVMYGIVPTERTFGKDGLRRFDIGWSLGIDFKHKRFFTGIGAEHGFVPIERHVPKDIFKYYFDKRSKLVSSYNIGLELHVGYYL